MHVVNPGRHRIENYFDGHFEDSWGQPGESPGDFCGCCNPVALAILPDQRFVTAEKGILHMKVYSHQGEFLGMVAGQDILAPNATTVETRAPLRPPELDVATDSRGRVRCSIREDGWFVFLRRRPGRSGLKTRVENEKVPAGDNRMSQAMNITRTGVRFWRRLLEAWLRLVSWLFRWDCSLALLALRGGDCLHPVCATERVQLAQRRRRWLRVNEGGGNPSFNPEPTATAGQSRR